MTRVAVWECSFRQSGQSLWGHRLSRMELPGRWPACVVLEVWMKSLKKKKKIYLFGRSGSWLRRDPSSLGHVESFSVVCRVVVCGLSCSEVYGI